MHSLCNSIGAYDDHGMVLAEGKDIHQGIVEHVEKSEMSEMSENVDKCGNGEIESDALEPDDCDKNLNPGD